MLTVGLKIYKQLTVGLKIYKQYNYIYKLALNLYFMISDG